jgi:hypothetical protein
MTPPGGRKKFVRSQSHLLALLRIAAPRDEQALASIQASTTTEPEPDR